MTFRSDLDALAARHTALETEVAQKTKELDQAGRMLDEARLKSKLPVLDNIRVASPCSADWAKMTGDERVRHCGDCKKNVFNISEMTRDEAEALILETAGRLCVRYYQRKDGTILLKDCTIGVKKARRRKLVIAGAAAMLAAGGTLAYMKYRESSKHHEEEQVMGLMTVGAIAIPIEDVPKAPDQNGSDTMTYQGQPALLDDHGSADVKLGELK